jgi:hypothetical protein
MKKLIKISLLLFASSAGAQQDLHSYDWQHLRQHHELLGGEVVSMGGESVLKIENTNDSPLQLNLFKIVKPPAASNAVYAITGRVKYEKVQGDGYLEMWNFFPPIRPGLPEGQYFSRTLGDAGEMAKITGTSDWRKLSLPFDPTGASGAPTRLEINLVLPGRGTVYLSPLKLIQYPGSKSSAGASSANAWWSEDAATWISVVGGPAIGCLGALLGWLAGNGKARKLVLAAWKCCIAGGIFALIAALVALAVGQPVYVWVPLLIFGIIPTVVFSVIWPSARKRYDDLELRRMVSMDAT